MTLNAVERETIKNHVRTLSDEQLIRYFDEHAEACARLPFPSEDEQFPTEMAEAEVNRRMRVTLNAGMLEYVRIEAESLCRLNEAQEWYRQLIDRLEVARQEFNLAIEGVMLEKIKVAQERIFDTFGVTLPGAPARRSTVAQASAASARAGAPGPGGIPLSLPPTLPQVGAQPAPPPLGPIGGGAVPRSCEYCPAYLDPDDSNQRIKQRILFGAVLGIPMCARRGIPLNTRNVDAADSTYIKEAYAKNCPGYGVPAEVSIPELKGAPFGQIEHVPVDDVIANEIKHSGLDQARQAGKPGSCAACSWCRPPDKVAHEIGIPLASCAAKGTLIPISRGRPMAEDCHLGIEDFDHRLGRARPWSLISPLAQVVVVTDFTPDASSAVAGAKKRVPLPDPATVETEAEVSAEDRNYGIRAWQKVYDPQDRRRFVLMPIFDPDGFSEEDRAKVPGPGHPSEDSHPELYDDHLGMLYTSLVAWLKLRRTPALNGDPGSGKTTFFEYAAWRMQLPFERVSITNSTELDDLQGRMNLLPGETGSRTEFVYGRVSRAWTRPCVLAIDEPNTGPNDVWQFFRPLIDDSKQMVLDVNRGEILTRHKYLFMGMSFNPAWDLRNVGTHEIGEADASRLYHLHVPMPDEARERDIIRARCAMEGAEIEERDLDLLIGVAQEIRALAEEQQFPVHWGLREQLKVALALPYFSPERAYRLALGDFLEPQYRDQLLAAVSSRIEGKALPSAPNGGRRGRK